MTDTPSISYQAQSEPNPSSSLQPAPRRHSWLKALVALLVVFVLLIASGYFFYTKKAGNTSKKTGSSNIAIQLTKPEIQQKVRYLDTVDGEFKIKTTFFSPRKPSPADTIDSSDYFEHLEISNGLVFAKYPTYNPDNTQKARAFEIFYYDTTSKKLVQPQLSIDIKDRIGSGRFYPFNENQVLLELILEPPKNSIISNATPSVTRLLWNLPDNTVSELTNFEQPCLDDQQVCTMLAMFKQSDNQIMQVNAVTKKENFECQGTDYVFNLYNPTTKQTKVIQPLPASEFKQYVPLGFYKNKLIVEEYTRFKNDQHAECPEQKTSGLFSLDKNENKTPYSIDNSRELYLTPIQETNNELVKVKITYADQKEPPYTFIDLDKGQITQSNDFVEYPTQSTSMPTLVKVKTENFDDWQSLAGDLSLVGSVNDAWISVSVFGNNVSIISPSEVTKLKPAEVLKVEQKCTIELGQNVTSTTDPSTPSKKNMVISYSAHPDYRQASATPAKQALSECLKQTPDYEAHYLLDLQTFVATLLEVKQIEPAPIIMTENYMQDPQKIPESDVQDKEIEETEIQFDMLEP